MAEGKSGRWVGLAGLGIGILALVPAYFIFWDKPDLVYEEQVIEILLPESVRTRLESGASKKQAPPVLPDKLLRLAVQNIGHKPSEQFELWIVTPGNVVHYELEKPNPAYGNLSISEQPEGLHMASARLTQSGQPINISVWFRQDPGRQLSIGISDKAGPARKLDSIRAAQDKWLLQVGFAALMVFMLSSGYYMYRSFSSEMQKIEAMLSKHEK